MQDKIVIITGASSGIGKALAERFARAKAKVVMAARSIEKMESLANSLRSQGADILCVKTDVSKTEDCQNLIDTTLKQYGKIDVLINNAGISMRGLFEETNLSVFERVMRVNFWGTLCCTRFAIPYILKSKGSVVGISSIAGHRGLPGRTGYSASKFAMHGLLESLRTEVMNRGVHVLVVAPGFTSSNIRKVALTQDGSEQGATPRDEDKMMSAEEVAEHILTAIQKRKRDLVLTRQGKLTVFLNKWIPSIMDGLVFNHMAKEPNSPFK